MSTTCLRNNLNFTKALALSSTISLLSVFLLRLSLKSNINSKKLPIMFSMRKIIRISYFDISSQKMKLSLRIKSFIQATATFTLFVFLMRIRLASTKPSGFVFAIHIGLDIVFHQVHPWCLIIRRYFTQTHPLIVSWRRHFGRLLYIIYLTIVLSVHWVCLFCSQIWDMWLLSCIWLLIEII